MIYSGSSKIDFNSGYIHEEVKRSEMRQRMQKSLDGILYGVAKYLSSVEGSKSSLQELAIVIYSDDIKRVIPEKLLADGSFKKPPRLAGGYLELSDRLLETFRQIPGAQ